MYRIRFHGRGGQGMKTASRILGTAFFLEGFDVQDAPRYGAERRGAPIFAYVRAARKTIHERGIIRQPDLVIVADDTLIPIPAAGVLSGISKKSILLIHSSTDSATWQQRLNHAGQILTLPVALPTQDVLELRYIGASCAGAATRLIGVISRDSLIQAIRDELSSLGGKVVSANLVRALESYDAMGDHEGCVPEGEETSAHAYERPAWIDLPFEDARVSAPVIHGALTSVEVKTGLWRTLRPVIDYERCNRCWWICSSFCPDGVISVNAESYPQIDYDHCKGCMVCLAQCPPHAIEAIPERAATATESHEN